MKIKNFLLIILMLTFTLPSYSSAQNLNCDELKSAFLVSLTPSLNKAIGEIYKDIPGGDRSYELFDAEILKLERVHKGWESFNVTIEIQTYVGAHNPPYGVDTIYLRVDPDNIKILGYEHKDL